MLKKHLKILVTIILALLCILVGIAGLVLPLLPGVVFVVLGLLLIATVSPRVDSWINKITFKYPLTRAPAEALKKFIERIIGKS
jgi:uncharacterized membrane protein YbaN (DUF454 family)